MNNTNDLRQIGQIYGFGKEKNPQAGRIYDPEYICPTLDSMSGGNRMPKTIENIRIRKLTPEECYTLQGLKPEYATKGREMGISDSALYFQAGNGICANCTQLIAEHLYKTQYDESYKCTDENFIQPEV